MALFPFLRGLASTDSRQVGHFTDSGTVLDFLASERHHQLAMKGTSCPDHFLRTKVRPLVLDLPADAPIDDALARLEELHEEYRAEYRSYYQRYATAESPPMRGPIPPSSSFLGSGCLASGATSKPPV